MKTAIVALLASSVLFGQAQAVELVDPVKEINEILITLHQQNSKALSLLLSEDEVSNQLVKLQTQLETDLAVEYAVNELPKNRFKVVIAD